MSTDGLDRLNAALAGRYSIEREIERGGMAVVYLAEDLKHPRRVAVKVLQRSLSATLATDRFLREIDVLATLQHPHILTLIESGEADGLPYYVMPFVEGQSLKTRLEKGPLPIDEAVRIAGEAADALTYAHEKGVIHRDVKPGNVLLSAGHAIVADFGIAAALDQAAVARLTETGVSLGSPAYMSPEQAAGEPVDARTDIYALGCVLYEMLSGKPPFEGSIKTLVTQKVLGKQQPLRDLRPDVPPPVARAVARAMATAPADRYDSAAAFREALRAGLPGPTAAPPTRRRTLVASVVVLAMVAAAITIRQVSTAGRDTLSAAEREQLERLIESDQTEDAHRLALQLHDRVGNEPELLRLWKLFSDTTSIVTEPPGARVFRRPYGTAGDTGWRQLGVTPLRGIRIPMNVAEYRFEAEGREPIHRAEFWLWMMPSAAKPIALPALGSTPDGMVWVQGDMMGAGSPGLDHTPALRLGSFLLDRFEVTNRQYQTFVDAGAYRNETWWTDRFSDGASTLSFADAMSRFVDRTGRPGPATWEAGQFPAGMGDHPVSGISWFEARAYARHVGKELPTVFHWTHALDQWIAGEVIPASNLGGSEAWPVGRGAIGRFGARDMGGNVREWLINASGTSRYIMGGGWNDPSYFLNLPYAASPWDRSPGNGVRLARYADTTNLAAASRPLELPFRDFTVERPAPAALYAVYRRMYDYDPVPMAARVEQADTTAEWVRQRITYNSPYGDDRIASYLFLPRRGAPPYQTVVFFPGTGATLTDDFEQDVTQVWDFLVKTGRAVLYPVFYGTFDRRVPGVGTQPDGSTRYRDNMIRWGKDFRRAVEYARTRADLDSARLGLLGFSWGGRQAPILLTIEPQIRAAVLVVAGLKFQTMLPEVDPLHFLPRVTTPTLVLNGTNDNVFPERTSQIPFFELLGTPAEHKKRITFEGDHFAPRSVLISNTLDWFDRYLGPVK
jgi:serine/threonine protein kinase/dienelactone hydrolase